MTGIKYYSTDSKAVKGEIKRRISDFIVREISFDGKKCNTTFDSDWDGKKIAKLKIPDRKNEKENQLILEMEKFNQDLNFVVRRIARYLQASNNRIGFGGMKDKRAVTSQKISIFEPNPEKLEEFNSKYIRLRNPQWSEKRIEIGDLIGNEFEIAIRNIELKKAELKKEIEKCFKQMEKGVINYFGEQRFGGARKITHLVGKEFVKGNFEKGVMLYLTSVFPEEEEEIKIARMNLAKTNDFSKASKEFPVKFRYERSIIHHLCRYPTDFVGAFHKLPKSLRYMFVHAYQSFLFNKVINARIEAKIGLKKTKDDILIDGIPSAPLFGFESVLASETIGEIESKVLGEEGIELKQFYVKQMPEISSKGARKKISLFPKKLKLLKIESDELNENKLKAVVSFELNKGDYATIVLRELMKNE